MTSRDSEDDPKRPTLWADRHRISQRGQSGGLAPVPRFRRVGMAGDRLPEPRPLAKAVAQANFGYDEDNHPIHPTAEQIQEMTETQAAKLMAIYEQMRSRPEDTDPALQAAADSLLRSYAGNFGERAALQLDKCARHRTSIQSPGSPSGRSR